MFAKKKKSKSKKFTIKKRKRIINDKENKPNKKPKSSKPIKE